MIATPLKTVAAVFIALAFLAPHGATAEPMKCSGEEKACITACKKTAKVEVSVCVTGCGSRRSMCVKTGCWDNGAQRYCGLTKS